MDSERVATVHERVRRILEASLLVPTEYVHADFVDAGVIDSADFMELFALLEQEFGIAIDASDLALENFRTIDRITAFVEAKRVPMTRG